MSEDQVRSFRAESIPDPGSLVDPRISTAPELGALPIVEEVEQGLIRVLAPNASAMTLDGTNSYLIYGTDGSAIVLDPGPDSPAHLTRMTEVASERGLDIRAVCLTHHHLDHSESAFSFASILGVKVFAHPECFDKLSYNRLKLSGRASISGIEFEVIPTPGHCGDHLSFLLPSGVLLTGDHILGRGTSVVVYPDGNLTQYLDSLNRVADIDFSRLAPGHGPVMDKGLGEEVISYYLAHRKQRLDQLITAIRQNPGVSKDELVDLVYGDLLTEKIKWAALASTLASLRYLEDAHIVVQNANGSVDLLDPPRH